MSPSRCAATLVVSACFVFGQSAVLAVSNPFDQTVKPLEIGEPLPATSFVNQHGRQFTFASLHGQAVVVGFIYTACKDACPIITTKFGQLDHVLGTGPYHLVEITIDPTHDTPRVMAAYAKKHGIVSPRWDFLTGYPATLQTFVRSAGVSVIDNGRGELVHNARLLIVSPDGRLADVDQLVAWEPTSVGAQVRALVGSASSPLARADFALTRTVAQFCGGSYQLASGIVDVMAALFIIAAGVLILMWLRRRIFAQGA